MESLVFSEIFQQCYQPGVYPDPNTTSAYQLTHNSYVFDPTHTSILLELNPYAIKIYGKHLPF